MSDKAVEKLLKATPQNVPYIEAKDWKYDNYPAPTRERHIMAAVLVEQAVRLCDLARDLGFELEICRIPIGHSMGSNDIEVMVHDRRITA